MTAISKYKSMVLQFQHEIDFRSVRSRGPGGQNVNKVSSAAVLNWHVPSTNFFNQAQIEMILRKLRLHINVDGFLYLRSDQFRDLEMNKKACLDKLAELLEIAFFVPKRRISTKPTYSSKVKKLDNKKRHSDIKKSRAKVKHF